MLGSRQQQLRADSGREQASQPSRIDYQKTEAVREGRRHRGQLAIISLYLTSSAARDCMPPAEHNLGRGSTSHASRRWRRGGPSTAARRRPNAAQRNDADRSSPRLPRHRSRPAWRLQASRSAATAYRRRLAYRGHVKPAVTAQWRRARSFTSAPRHRPRLARNRLKNENKTTHRHDSRKDGFPHRRTHSRSGETSARTATPRDSRSSYS